MTYPPGSPGYPPAQQPTTQFAAPTQQFGKVPDAAPAAEGPSKLPVYLTAAVAALGLAVYLSSYGPLFAASADFFTPTLLDLGVVAALLAGLIAGVGLVPKQKSAPALVAVLSVLGFLLVIAIVLTAPQGVEIEWGLYLIIAFSVVQAIVAVAVLLFDAGVIAPPAPKPRYEQQQQYGQYGGPGRVLRTAPSARSAAPQPADNSSAPAIRRLTAVATRAVRRRADSPAGQQSGPRRRPPDFPTYGQPPSSSRTRRSATGVEQCADDTGARAAVVFHAVRPAAVVVWAARASTSRA